MLPNHKGRPFFSLNKICIVQDQRPPITRGSSSIRAAMSPRSRITKSPKAVPVRQFASQFFLLLPFCPSGILLPSQLPGTVAHACGPFTRLCFSRSEGDKDEDDRAQTLSGHPGMPPSSPASPRDQHTRKAHRTVLDAAYLQGPAG